jgi:hypothetical protein
MLYPLPSRLHAKPQKAATIHFDPSRVTCRPTLIMGEVVRVNSTIIAGQDPVSSMAIAIFTATYVAEGGPFPGTPRTCQLGIPFQGAEVGLVG